MLLSNVFQRKETIQEILLNHFSILNKIISSQMTRLIRKIELQLYQIHKWQAVQAVLEAQVVKEVLVVLEALVVMEKVEIHRRDIASNNQLS